MNKSAELQRIFLQTMVKPECESWLQCDSLLTKILQQKPHLSESFQVQIRERIPKIKNLLVLMLVYTHKVKTASYTHTYSSVYAELRKQSCLDIIDSWLQSLKDEGKVQRTVELVLQGLGMFFNKEVKRAKVEECKFMLRQLARYSIRREREINVMINFMGRLQMLEFTDTQLAKNKETLLISVIVELLTDPKEKLANASNLGLIFDEPCLGSTFEQNIQRYIHLNQEFLMTLTEQQLLSLFSALTRSAISYPTLSFLLFLTNQLAREEQFYKLRHLYEHLVLCQIARRGKCCRKPKIQEAVLRIAETFVVGFLAHCRVGRTGVACLLENVEEIDNEIKDKWVALAQMISNKEEAQVFEYFTSQLKVKNLVGKEKVCDGILRNNYIWEITARSIKKHKVYTMHPSDLTGISNQGNQCYIISIVQALFMTKLLKSLLEKASTFRFGSVIRNLRNIFKDLSKSVYNSAPNVNALKKYGPQYFAENERQQDAQSYLISLLEQLEKQLKEEKLLQDFKRIFEIESKDILECLNCKYRTENKQSEYVHTIHYKQSFSVHHQQEIHDYQCPKCKKKRFSKTTELTLNNRILIVHINRFSVKNSSTKKELPTQKIKRRIEGGFELVGMVFHIGKSMQSGHYIYYSKVHKTRWAEMNDSRVTEFDLEQEDEEFELEMKSEKTPYILFYKRGGTNE